MRATRENLQPGLGHYKELIPAHMTSVETLDWLRTTGLKIVIVLRKASALVYVCVCVCMFHTYYCFNIDLHP